MIKMIQGKIEEAGVWFLRRLGVKWGEGSIGGLLMGGEEKKKEKKKEKTEKQKLRNSQINL